MSYPRKKLDLQLLILEAASCAVMEQAAKKQDPKWDFNRFEAVNFGMAEKTTDDEKYEAYRVLALSEAALDALDAERPFLLPLERGVHYVWELFVELPRVGNSSSTHQFWNRLARVMSEINLPITEEELSKYFEQALLYLLKDATDLGDRFYLSDLDYGGWSGGIVSKDFLIEGLQMLVKKLSGPVCEHTVPEKE